MTREEHMIWAKGRALGYVSTETEMRKFIEDFN